MSMPAKRLPQSGHEPPELTIHAVAFARFVHQDSTCQDPKHIPVYVPDEFVFQADPVLKNGCYMGEKPMQQHIGSYAYYNFWLDELSRVVHKLPAWKVRKSEAQYRGKPFIELITLPDISAVVGFFVCGKLAHDFAAFRYEDTGGSPGYTGALTQVAFWETYGQLGKAFAHASHAGFVLFP